MSPNLKSFKIRSGNKILDYRLGEKFDLNKIKTFFQEDYEVKKIWHGTRHIFAVLVKKGMTFFLKLSTSEGISIVTKNEYEWNNYFNKYFEIKSLYRVPKNYVSGLYKEKYFYLITDYFDGKLLCLLNASIKESNGLIKYILRIIDLSELIQKLPQVELGIGQRTDFINKARNWFSDIPVNLRKKFNVLELLNIVEEGMIDLSSRPKHGDFTPWHIIIMKNSGLGLVDGEHAQAYSVENYDICYFIQRVFSVLKNPRLAKEIYARLLKRNYKRKKIKTVLAARAIGGFLDDYIAGEENYLFAKNFKDWVIQI